MQYATPTKESVFTFVLWLIHRSTAADTTIHENVVAGSHAFLFESWTSESLALLCFYLSCFYFLSSIPVTLTTVAWLVAMLWCSWWEFHYFHLVSYTLWPLALSQCDHCLSRSLLCHLRYKHSIVFFPSKLVWENCCFFHHTWSTVNWRLQICRVVHLFNWTSPK